MVKFLSSIMIPMFYRLSFLKAYSRCVINSFWELVSPCPTTFYILKLLVILYRFTRAIALPGIYSALDQSLKKLCWFIKQFLLRFFYLLIFVFNIFSSYLMSFCHLRLCFYFYVYNFRSYHRVIISNGNSISLPP